jgi:hypothetical protein
MQTQGGLFVVATPQQAALFVCPRFRRPPTTQVAREESNDAMSINGGDMTAAFATALEGASAEPSADASPASTPVQTSDSAPQGEATAAAIAQPEIPTTDTVVPSTEDKPKGEPPAWRWQDILENTRKTVAEETAARIRQEVEQQYADLRDFQGLDATQREGLKVWNRALSGDPAAMAHVQQAAKSNPALAQALRAFVGPEPTPAQADPEPEPDAAIQLQDGTQVPVYTADGQRKRDAWLRRQLGPELKSQMAEEFKPLAGAAEHFRQLQQQAQLQQASTQWASSVLAPLSELPHFAEFKPELGQALAALPETATDVEMQRALYQAYTRLHTAKLDALTKSGEAKALADIHKRAIAGTGNPTSPSTTTPGTFKPGVDGFTQALEHFSGAGR